MSKERPFILISNDDGVNSTGIELLAEIASEYGDVMVFAPDSERSGQGHAVTVKKPLFAKLNKVHKGIEFYQCSGTPVDCIKLAVKMFTHKKPDLVLSGINHGTNAGVNVFYSGTMAAAVEAVFEGIPAIGFSIDTHDSYPDFTEIIPYTKEIIEIGLKNNIPPHCCWNVNFPYKFTGGIKGLKACKMSRGFWNDKYEKRIMPATEKPYYWIYGDYGAVNPCKDSDHDLLKQGYGVIVPVSIDITEYEEVKRLQAVFK